MYKYIQIYKCICLLSTTTHDDWNIVNNEQIKIAG